jgi:hypothetical protein
MNNEFRRPVCSKIGVYDRFFVFGHQQLPVARVLFRVENEARVDDIPRQRKDIEGPVNQMIPLARDVQASDFAVTSRLVFNCSEEMSEKISHCEGLTCGVNKFRALKSIELPLNQYCQSASSFLLLSCNLINIASTGLYFFFAHPIESGGGAGFNDTLMCLSRKIRKPAFYNSFHMAAASNGRRLMCVCVRIELLKISRRKFLFSLSLSLLTAWTTTHHRRRVCNSCVWHNMRIDIEKRAVAGMSMKAPITLNPFASKLIVKSVITITISRARDGEKITGLGVCEV